MPFSRELREARKRLSVVRSLILENWEVLSTDELYPALVVRVGAGNKIEVTPTHRDVDNKQIWIHGSTAEECLRIWGGNIYSKKSQVDLEPLDFQFASDWLTVSKGNPVEHDTQLLGEYFDDAQITYLFDTKPVSDSYGSEARVYLLSFGSALSGSPGLLRTFDFFTDPDWRETIVLGGTKEDDEEILGI